MINYSQWSSKNFIETGGVPSNGASVCLMTTSCWGGEVALVVIREFMKVHISSVFATVTVNFFSACSALTKLTVTIAKLFFSVTSVLLTCH